MTQILDKRDEYGRPAKEMDLNGQGRRTKDFLKFIMENEKSANELSCLDIPFKRKLNRDSVK